jgi:hypothetical protein
MKKYFTLIITLLTLSSISLSQTLSLGKVTCSSTPLTSVLVPLNVSAPLGSVKSVTLQFSYDNTCVRFDHDATDPQSGISNIALSDSGNIAITENNGLISLSWFNSAGSTLNGKIFDLDFKYLTSFSEVKIVNATIKNLQGKKLTVNLSNGSIATDTSHSVKLIYPNGGENIEVTGSPTTITWTSVYISKVKLEYTTDNGSNWDSIATNLTASTDSYVWTVPNTINSSDCKIRISEVDQPTTNDLSDNKFTINSVPVISLLTPTGGEELKVDGYKTIKWYSRNIINLKIEYTTNDTAATPIWQSISSTLAASDSSYDWHIPSTLSKYCRVRVSDLANPTSVYDTSDASFTIMNSPIKVQVDSVVQAKLDIIGKVIGFWYHYWGDIEGGIGLYSWRTTSYVKEINGHNVYAHDTLDVKGTVPVRTGWLTSLQYLKMSFKFDSNVLELDSVISRDKNLSSFSYVAKDSIIRITWASGTPVDLHGNIFDLKFRYKKIRDPLQWIKKADWDDGDFSGFNPETPHVVIDPRNFSTIRVDSVYTRNTYNELIDASDWKNGSLAVSDQPAVKLLSPVGGEILEVNDGTKTILWSSRKVTNVALNYSTDSGSSWTSITTSTGSSTGTGSFTWTLPNVNDSTCLVRITDVDHSSVNDTSSAVFRITNVKSISLTSPNGGEVLKVGKSKFITWACRNISNVKLEYSSNNDTTWTLISASQRAKDYKYDWLVPNVLSTECRVRISEVGDTARVDTSDNLFTINDSKVKVSIPYLVCPAGSITVPVQSEQLFSVTYMSLSVKYDTLKMVIDTVLTTSKTNSGLFHYIKDHGTIRMVWYSTTSKDLQGTLFYIYFTGYTGSFSEFLFTTPNQIKDTLGRVMDVEFVNGNIGTTDVVNNSIPTKYTLQQNFPNPFNPTTTIQYEIPKQTHVIINIYNCIGQRVTTLVNENVLPGYFRTVWNSAGCASGIYFYQIITNEFVQTKKMILLK